MPCRFASSGTVATSRSASRAILALNVASNFLRDLVISVLHRLKQSRTLHTLTFGPISGVHFTISGMVDTAAPLAVFVAIALSLIPHDMQYGPQAALIAEAFTPRLRYSGAAGPERPPVGSIAPCREKLVFGALNRTIEADESSQEWKQSHLRPD